MKTFAAHQKQARPHLIPPHHSLELQFHSWSYDREPVVVLQEATRDKIGTIYISVFHSVLTAFFQF